MTLHTSFDATLASLSPQVATPADRFRSGTNFELPATRRNRRGHSDRFADSPALNGSQLRSAVLGFADSRAKNSDTAGIIPSWIELADHLRDCGFADDVVATSGLSRAVSAASGTIGETWCVPVSALPGRRDGLAFRAVGQDDEPWQVAECGDVVAGGSQLVLVSCPMEAARLRDAGLTETCVAEFASVTSGFWEDLASRGIEQVTILGCRANDEWDAMNVAASAARTAFSTPGVELHELPSSCGRSCVGELQGVGVDAFRRRLFSEGVRNEIAVVAPTVRMPEPKVEAFDASAYWAAVRPAIARIHEPQQRRIHERLAVEVCEQLRSGRVSAAEAAIEGGSSEAAVLPTSVSHHVENVRSTTASAALAKRLFDVLRSTGGRVSVATPMSEDAFLDFAASAAVGHGQHPQLAGRSADQLRMELEALGHRLHVITTPRPQELDGEQAAVFGASDVIVLDLTAQTSMLWWEQNGCCGRMTRLAESVDADLVAFWPASSSRMAPASLRDDVLTVLREQVRKG